MKKVLFTHSYFYKFDPKQWRFKQPYPPLGTLFAAALMRESGYEVALHDNNLRDGPEELRHILESEKPDYLVIYDDGFNYLTKMCLTNMRQAAFRMAQLGKEAGCKVIVSSSDATDHYKRYLDNGADYVLLGEAEITLKELLNRLDKKEDIGSVPGLACRPNGEIKLTAKRSVLRELDKLPLPAWDLVDIEAYRRIWKKHHGYFSLNIATTRGCPFKCNWCAKPIYGNRYNSRSPENVADEIALLQENYQPDHFWICDDIFGLKPGWVQQLRDVVKRRGLDFRYKIQSRVDLLLQEDTIDALAESGLETVWVGAESGSQKILDAMDKGTKVEQIYEATRLLKRKGVRVAFFLQFGYLGETKADIDQTIRMLLELMPEEVGISVSYPLPGTKFYEKVKHHLQGKTNWTDSDDLDMMYQSTFNSAYYRRLHRYVHKVYRIKRGWLKWKEILRNPVDISYQKARSALATFYYIPSSLIDRFRLARLQASN